MPFVSVVVPTYNRAGLIGNLIANIQKQTVADWECLIVDDLSDDNTEEVVALAKAKDKRISFYTNERSKGAQGARNTGILKATTEWIAFNDSDDDWHPQKLEWQIEALKKRNNNPNTVVHGNCTLVKHADNSRQKWELPLIEGDKPFKDLLRTASPVFPSLFTSKKALLEIGLLDEKVPSYQEWDTSLMLARNCYFVHLQQSLFDYNIHAGDTISKSGKRDITGFHYILMKFQEDIIAKHGKDFFVTRAVDNIKRCVQFKEWELGRKLLRDVKSTISSKAFYFYNTCFTLRVNPDKIRAVK